MTAGIIAANANNTTGHGGNRLDGEDPAGTRDRQVRRIADVDMADAIRWAAGLTVTTPGVTVPNNANPAKVIYDRRGHRAGRCV